jgi:hypothetical protein
METPPLLLLSDARSHESGAIASGVKGAHASMTPDAAVAAGTPGAGDRFRHGFSSRVDHVVATIR